MTSLAQHFPDKFQVRGNRTSIQPPRERQSLGSHLSRDFPDTTSYWPKTVALSAVEDDSSSGSRFAWRFAIFVGSAECPLLAISRHPEGSSRTSALPPIADIQIMIPGQALANVRFAPNSGPNSTLRWMSAFDPKRTLPLRTPPAGCDILAIKFCAIRTWARFSY